MLQFVQLEVVDELECFEREDGGFDVIELMEDGTTRKRTLTDEEVRERQDPYAVTPFDFN